MSIQDFGLIGFLVAIPSTWYWIVRRLREKGRGLLVRQGAAFLVSPLAGMAVFAFITDPLPGAAFSAVVFTPVYLMTRRRSKSTDADQRISSNQASPVALSQEFKLSEIAKAVYETGPDRDSPLKRWNEATPKVVESQLSDMPTGDSIVHGRRLDVIRFDYLNAKGELASRRVKVTMVGQWQFEGIDLSKREERTFRHDRVIGDITSELTGEINDPIEWASSIIDRNAAVDA